MKSAKPVVSYTIDSLFAKGEHYQVKSGEMGRVGRQGTPAAHSSKVGGNKFAAAEITLPPRKQVTAFASKTPAHTKRMWLPLRTDSQLADGVPSAPNNVYFR